MDLSDEAAPLMMGFGKQGGSVEEHLPVEWRWGVGMSNYMVWLGSAEAGVRLRLTCFRPRGRAEARATRAMGQNLMKDGGQVLR